MLAKNNTTESLSTLDPRVILITGNMAAGKSTVAQALAERLNEIFKGEWDDELIYAILQAQWRSLSAR